MCVIHNWLNASVIHNWLNASVMRVSVLLSLFMYKTDNNT